MKEIDYYCNECGSSKPMRSKMTFTKRISNSEWWLGHDKIDSYDKGIFKFLMFAAQVVLMIIAGHGIDLIYADAEGTHNPRAGIAVLITYVILTLFQIFVTIYEFGLKSFLKWSSRIIFVMALIILTIWWVWMLAGEIEGWLL